MGMMINRRRVMVSVDRFKPTILTSHPAPLYYADTGFYANAHTYIFETRVCFNTVDSSKRQLFGADYEPFWGCDKGKWRGNANIANGTPVEEGVWYDVTTVAQKGNRRQHIAIFNCSGSYPNYQCYCSIKDYYRIYGDGVLLADYIPGIYEGSEVFFDTITKNFIPIILS